MNSPSNGKAQAQPLNQTAPPVAAAQEAPFDPLALILRMQAEAGEVAQPAAEMPAKVAEPIVLIVDEPRAAGPDPNQTLALRRRPARAFRVDLERVDRLIDLVGELVINQAMLSQRVMEAGIAGASAIGMGLDELEAAVSRDPGQCDGHPRPTRQIGVPAYAAPWRVKWPP